MGTFLLFGVYLPCDDHNASYCNAVSHVLVFIDSVVDDYPGAQLGVLGDFNFDCNLLNAGYRVFQGVCCCS